MPNNYNINFSNTWQNLMPPNKRLTKYLAWGKVLVYPLQWLHQVFFVEYKDGNPSANWDIGTSYSVGVSVKYIDKCIYYCIKNTTAGIDPLQTEYWYKTQDIFIGLTDRMKYTSQKMVFEYALNSFFELTYLQPPSVSPIYIENFYVDVNSFIVGQNDIDTAYAVLEGSQALDFVGETKTSYNPYSFFIFYPLTLATSLYPSLSVPNAMARVEGQIANIANKLKISGTNYTIISY
jgi:hypothetical protein